MATKGFLLVLMHCPPSFEEEFNAWYDAEHVPERLAVPGFETGLRFVCIDGAPRYLAMYDLAAPGVLASPDYLKVSGDRSSPWTRRVTGRVRTYRSAGAQVYPGNVVTGRAARVVLLRFSGLRPDSQPEVIAGMRANFERLSAVRQVRVFACDRGSGIDFVGFVEAGSAIDHKLDLTAFGACADAIDLINTYAPY